ncbi:hypothetical protein BJX70DRAFT_367919 [Aspergillus crustosus]
MALLRITVRVSPPYLSWATTLLGVATKIDFRSSRGPWQTVSRRSAYSFERSAAVGSILHTGSMVVNGTILEREL